MITEKPPTTDNIKLGILLLSTGFFTAFAGVFPILGLLVQALSPNIFFIGLVLIAIGLFVASLSIVAGLNTRLPALIMDISVVNNSNTQVLSRIEGTVVS